MTPDGPHVVAVPDEHWPSFYHEERDGVPPWYERYLRILPRAFTHTDGDGEPDAQDTIWAKLSLVEAARRYYAAPEGRSALRRLRDYMAALLMAHEYGHNMGYSHPSRFVASLRHAFRVRLGVMAFSGLVRWRWVPRPLFVRFSEWVAAGGLDEEHVDVLLLE